MATQIEEQQTKEFLKRAEIRTMKKDLQALREIDALKERYKIINVKTLDEQRQEQEKKLKEKEEQEAAAKKAGLEKVLSQNAVQERLAEKDLKQYATEQERQQIFQLESQRLISEKQADAVDQQKEPALKLEKNRFLLQKRDSEAKLNLLKEDSRKLDTEENFLNEKIKQTNTSAEKKSLEQRRWEIEEQRKEKEKRIWEAEKQTENIDNKIREIDRSSEQLTAEKNALNQKILGIDKSLREIYSGVIARAEEKRRTNEEAKRAGATEVAKIKAEEKEKIQRQQRSGMPPVPVKKVLKKSFEAEEEQRKKFLQDVEEGIKK